ncbi:MAG: methionine gamma-lyase family protein [Clostridia bacterium]|nr:methionine gamma-lyase family protein [Clostridia bacterium]
MTQIDPAIARLIDEAEGECRPFFDRLEQIERSNTHRVLASFQKHRVSARHFAPTTGYGYDDIGRDTLSAIMAELLGCEAALVRPQIASGTHALALCLYGALRPGDTLLAASGRPYDTLEEVIGLSGKPGSGSLSEYGVKYREIDVLEDGRLNLAAIERALREDASIRLVELQRSRGYAWRPSLSMAQIGEAARLIHSIRPDVVVMLDNCYGEFSDFDEPGAVGVDLLAGSMIKNPGGGLAPTGGYVAGRRDLVDLVSYRLTSPGIGAEVGSYAASYQPFYQGLFMAPHVVAQAIKTAILAARVFEKLGYAVNPRFDEPRADIIQAIRFGRSDSLIAFIQGIQLNSPVDSEALPEPWDMPGYQDPVIMAAGTFVAGASIELSADAPIREPYIAYMQGALTYAHGRCGLEGALQYMKDKGLLAL